MVSDAELVGRLREILRSSDLGTTTAAIVRRRLEQDFGVDLSAKKVFIREQIDVILGELNESEVEENREDGEGDDVKEEEEEEGGSGGGEVEVDEEDEEVQKGRSSNDRNGSKKRSSKTLTAEVKKRGGGFTKLCSLSPKLQNFVSAPELPRTEVVKRLWAYIRENSLQDPRDKRMIICDERLESLFKVNKINMFQMNKALSKHIWPLSQNGPVESVPKEKPEKNVSEGDASQKGEQEGGISGPVKSLHKKKPHKKLSEGPVESAPKEKPQEKVREVLDDASRKGKRQEGGTSGPMESAPEEKRQKKVREDDASRKGKRQKGDTSDISAPLLSDDMRRFIGTGENALSKSDVIKRIWYYIKKNNLQDPADKKNILCDDKLKELFQVDSFNDLTVSKLLAAHIKKAKEK